MRLRRDYPPDVVDGVIRRLAADRLIDDAAFAELWVHSRQNSKPRSAWMVRRELLNKGIASHIADAALSDFDDDQNARRAAAAYARRLANTDHDTFTRRLFGYMRRRGFGASTSRRIISELWRSRPTSTADAAVDGQGYADDAPPATDAATHPEAERRHAHP